MDKNKQRIVDAFFKGSKDCKRTYLPPPTSQKYVPQGMNGLDSMLRNLRIENEGRSMEKLDEWLEEEKKKRLNRH